MQFNDATNKQGIVQDAYFEAGADAVSYPIADVTRNANEALNNVVTLALFANKNWDFGSSNATDLPIGTTDILSGQQDYEYDSDFLSIKAIEIQDSTGDWTRLEHIDVLSMTGNQAISDFEPNSGIPKYYDSIESSFFLYPAPNYNRRLVEEGEAGIKVYFQRALDLFTASDTTKEPGIPSHLHKYISLYCAYVYTTAKDMPRQNSLRQRLEWYEGNQLRGGNDVGAIQTYYARKTQDIRPRLTVRQDSTR